MTNAIKPAALVATLPLALGGCDDIAALRKPPDPRCYSIGSGPEQVAGGQLLLNQCTGDTWLLVRSTEQEGKPGERDTITYVWYKLGRYDFVNPSLEGPLRPLIPGLPQPRQQ